MNFEKPDDRLPMIEWAGWWDETHLRWQRDGLPLHLRGEDLSDYFGLDELSCIQAHAISSQCPKPAYHGAGIITDEASYEKIRPYILTDALIEKFVKKAFEFRDKHSRGEIAVRFWLDGFFWHPRQLFGITGHF